MLTARALSSSEVTIVEEGRELANALLSAAKGLQGVNRLGYQSLLDALSTELTPKNLSQLLGPGSPIAPSRDLDPPALRNAQLLKAAVEKFSGGREGLQAHLIEVHGAAASELEVEQADATMELLDHLAVQNVAGSTSKLAEELQQAGSFSIRQPHVSLFVFVGADGGGA